MPVYSSETQVKHLPSPDHTALQHSLRLQQHIQAQIQQQPQQRLSFQDFMQQALYAPQLGYYTAGLHKFGQQGDFITAPELSPLFAQCLARQCQPVLAAMENPEILEFGAGSGKLALELLRELERLDCLPQQYYILEPSIELVQRQRALLKEKLPHLYSHVTWLQRLDVNINGVIIANEVLDAMPVDCFRVEDNGMSMLMVENEANALVANWYPTEQPIAAHLNLDLPVGYVSEVNPNIPAWIQAVSDSLNQGVVLLIDYGFGRSEYYHPQRDSGTLMCHYQHHSHDNPLVHVGLQDITAHVDFTHVAEAAQQADLQVAGFTSQAQFLLANGLESFLQHADPNDVKAHLMLTQQIKKLVLPEEMGELFKVMALSRDYDVPLAGFIMDRRNRL